MPDAIGLVLAGGGARGAYEAGVLRALLPALAERGERPGIVVGTSVGALNAAYLATNADEDAATLAENARKEWLSISYSDVLEPFLSLGELATAWRLPLGVVDRRVLPFSLLDPKPLRAKLAALVDSAKIHDNVAAGHIACCAVVATAAHTNRSVVFHEGGPDPQGDERRAIDYGGARGRRRVVPYIFVVPREPNAIGSVARRVYERSYGSARDLLGDARDLYLLGRLIGANRNTTRAELFSYLFFAHEFAQELLELRKADARQWLAESHEDGVWQLGPLPRG